MFLLNSNLLEIQVQLSANESYNTELHEFWLKTVVYLKEIHQLVSLQSKPIFFLVNDHLIWLNIITLKELKVFRNI